MKFNKLIAFLLALCMVFTLCACGETSPVRESDKPVSPSDNPDKTGQKSATTVTDMIGRQVEIVPGSYERVVCIGAGALRMYSYVGDISLLCGVEDIDNLSLKDRPQMFDGVARPYMLANSDFFATLPSCGVGGPNAQTAEAEKILSCNPDIVISEYEDAQKADALQAQLGIPVITLKAGPNGVFEDCFIWSLRLLGEVFGTSLRAEDLCNFVFDQKNEIIARAKGADRKQRTAYICGLGNWGTTNHLMTAQNYLPFEIANVKNAVNDLKNDGMQAIEAEKFVALGDKMDIMFIDTAAVKNIQPLYDEDPTMFDNCKAWQNGEVYLEMAYNAYYTNYEIALINTWFIAKTVYPELFADINITAKTNEITRMFNGKELANEIFACPASFGGYGKIDTATFFG